MFALKAHFPILGILNLRRIQRRQMAVLTVLFVKLRAFLRLDLVNGPEDLRRPGRRFEPGKCGWTGEQSFHLPQIFHIHRGTIELGWIGEIDPGANSQRLANISHHGLLNRSVVLHPGKPACVPERGKIRRRIRDPQIFLTATISPPETTSLPSWPPGTGPSNWPRAPPPTAPRP